MALGNVQSIGNIKAINPFLQTRNVQVNRSFALGLESIDREISPQVCSTKVAESHLGNKFDSNKYLECFGR